MERGRSLRLTEKANQLVEPLEQALAPVAQVLAKPRFDAGVSTHHFRVATADYVTALTAPEMAAIMSKEAPSITLQMLTARGRSVAELPDLELLMVFLSRRGRELELAPIGDLLDASRPRCTREKSLKAGCRRWRSLRPDRK